MSRKYFDEPVPYTGQKIDPSREEVVSNGGKLWVLKLRAAYSHLKNTLRDSKVEIGEMKSHIQELEEGKEHLRLEAEKYRNQASAYKEEVKSLRSGLKADQRIQDLRKKVQEKDKEIARLRKINTVYMMRLTQSGLDPVVIEEREA